jgi:hypothetical protein
MADKLPVVCPSKGRAGRVTSLDLFPDLIFLVHKSELADYRAAYPLQKIETHDVVGLGPIRNEICDRFGDVFMVDDDLTTMHSLWQGPGEPRVRPDPPYVRRLIERLYTEACELDVHLFAFNRYLHPFAYRAEQPFHLTGLVPEHAFGCRPTPELRWHPDVKVATDYWISALNAYLYRILWLDMRWAIGQAKTMAQTGGLASARTLEVERADNVILRRTFGSTVIRPKRATQASKMIHDSQRRLVIPW